MLNDFDIRLEPADGFPNFSEVSPATWRTLEACVRDASFIDDAEDAMIRRAQSFHQRLAAPALASVFRTDERFGEAIRDADPDHLAGLLVALLRASFDAHVHAAMSDARSV
jgi:hypothetical protein